MSVQQSKYSPGAEQSIPMDDIDFQSILTKCLPGG